MPARTGASLAKIMSVSDGAARSPFGFGRSATVEPKRERLDRRRSQFDRCRHCVTGTAGFRTKGSAPRTRRALLMCKPHYAAGSQVRIIATLVTNATAQYDYGAESKDDRESNQPPAG